MPQTKTRRAPRQDQPVHYNPIFPGGNNGQRPDNAKARVAYGDNGVNALVKMDSDPTKSKKYR